MQEGSGGSQDPHGQGVGGAQGGGQVSQGEEGGEAGGGAEGGSECKVQPITDH